MSRLIPLTAWLLILTAVAIILGTGYTTREYFMGQKEFPKVFKCAAPAAERTPLVANTQAASALSTEEQIRQALDHLTAQITGSENTFKVMNMASWLVFSIFSLFLSTRLAAIGIKLLFGGTNQSDK